MKFTSVVRWLLPSLLVLSVVLAPARAAFAEEYVLGPEDEVAISVWLHPELERTVAINADGNVTIPPVGEIAAAGLTTKQLGERIADRLSSYLRQTTTVTVTVAKYMSRSVFVTGSVAHPGRYGFERIPSIVEVLGAAGGAQTGADLANVQVVRTENGTRRTLSADVAAAMREADTSRLPALRPGDTIILSGVIPGGGQGPGLTPGEGAAVLGEVSRPGLVPVGDGADVWAVLAAAGGTTQHANLRSVRVLTRTESGVTVASHDLREVLDHGSASPVTVHSGDVVVVLSKGANPWTGLVSVLAVSRDLLNVAVLVDYLNNRQGN